ncbi:MAG: hypothetical protein H0V24_15585 [Chloroflexia bacterium]|nr:hypothetical protein [Chloroflexia bacterium]
MKPKSNGLGTIVVLNRDLMFGVRIANQLRAAGYTVSFAQKTSEFVSRLRLADPKAVLGVVDMNTPVEWPLIQALVLDTSNATPLLGFGPHLDVPGRRAAKAAGVSRIVTNGEFHHDTIGFVRRYAKAM